jgi:hypothetical protein
MGHAGLSGLDRGPLHLHCPGCGVWQQHVSTVKDRRQDVREQTHLSGSD